MKVDTQTIRQLIAERRSQGAPVRGVWLRQELSSRFGARASTDRIYRLIAEAGDGEPVSPRLAELQARVSDLESQLQQADAALSAERRRAELAEEREVHHQEKWAAEIDGLRQKLQVYQRAGRYDQLDQQLKLHRELFAARSQNSRLREKLTEHGLALDDDPEW